MNYYQITADIHPLSDSEPELIDDEEEDTADPNWFLVKASASTLPSVNKVNDDDQRHKVVRKIDEIFETIVPSVDAEEKSHATVVRRRPRQARTQPSNRQRRTLHTVSGYFSDWAKWLTDGHPSWGIGSNSAAADVVVQEIPQPKRCSRNG